MLGLQPVDPVQPVGMAVLGHARIQLAQYALHVADYRNVDLHVLADLGRVDVNVDLLRAPGEGAGAARNPIVEPHPQGDQQVRLLYRQAGVGHAVHAGHPDAQDVVVREAADAQERGDHRYLGLLRQLADLVEGLREDHAVAGQDHRALRPVDQLCGPLDLPPAALQRRPVARQVDLHARVVFVEAVEGKRHLVGLDVLGHVDENRPRPARGSDVEHLLDDPRDLLSVQDEVIVLGHRQGDARRVRLLEGVTADGGPHDLAHYGDHGHRVHLRRGYARYEVGGARA